MAKKPGVFGENHCEAFAERMGYEIDEHTPLAMVPGRCCWDCHARRDWFALIHEGEEYDVCCEMLKSWHASQPPHPDDEPGPEPPEPPVPPVEPTLTCPICFEEVPQSEMDEHTWAHNPGEPMVKTFQPATAAASGAGSWNNVPWLADPARRGQYTSWAASTASVTGQIDVGYGATLGTRESFDGSCDVSLRHYMDNTRFTAFTVTPMRGGSAVGAPVSGPAIPLDVADVATLHFSGLSPADMAAVDFGFRLLVTRNSSGGTPTYFIDYIDFSALVTRS
jgi:hypothetical protein